MAHEDPPTPPPPPSDETAPTGSWNLADLPPDDEPAPAGPPSVGILHTGAFPAPPKEDAPAPAGPPSVGILHTGAFYPPPSAEQRSVDPATLEATVIEAAPRRDAPSNVPTDTVALRGGSTVDLPGPPTPPPPPVRPRTGRPLEPMTPPPPADDDPALQATRPPSAPVGVVEAPSGGGWLWTLVALVCLAGAVYLVRHAMPELFQRGTDGAAGLTNPRPGVIAGRLAAAPAKVDWRVLEAGVERARGTVAPRADGGFELALDDLAEGTHQVTVELSGPGGAHLATQALPVRVDRTAPALRLLSPADAASVGTGGVVALEVADRSRVQVTCFIDDVIAWRESVDPLPDGGPARLERPLAALSPGAHTIAINAVDETLRQSKVAHRVTVGPTKLPPKPSPPSPPVVRLAWQDGAVVGPGTLEVSVDPAAEVTVLLDRRPFGGLPVRLAAGAVTDGRHVIEVRATNAGGETRESRAFRFDGTPPALDGVSAPARGPSRVELTGAVRDAVDPAPKLTLSVDGGPAVAVERLPHALDLAPGPHTLALVATDAAGNEARRALQVQVEPAGPVAPADTAGPEVTIVSPGGAPTYVSRERKVEVRITDASGVAQARLSLDNRARRPERTDEQGAVVLRLDLADLPDGDHLLAVEASDVHGNDTRTSRTWRLDTTPPEVTLVGPAPTTVAAPFDVAVTVRDAGPVTGVIIVVPGRGAQPMPETAPGERRARVELPPGDHEVVVRASDEAGNEGTLALRVSVQAPTLPPVVDPPAETPVVRFPARSLPRVVIDGALPAGARATIDSSGLRLASDVTSLPVEVTLPAGPQTVVVSVQLRTGRRQQFQGVVVVDATRPALDRVRIMARSTRAAEVTGAPQDDGPVTVEVLVNGVVQGRALPCEVPLGPGLNEVVVVARDDVGNEARVSSKIDVAGGPATTTATPPPAVAPIDVVDSNDPREARALEALKAGRLDEAQRLVEQVIDAVRQGIRSPYVLRARISIARAAQVRGEVFKRDHLNAAEQDLSRAIINYGDDARSVHFKLRGDVLTELGRGRAAMLDYRRARELERRGR